MFEARREILDRRTHRIEMHRRGDPLSYADVLGLWQESEAFRTTFLAVLGETPFTAYRWETPPVCVDRLARPFECVLRESLEIDVPADGRGLL
jgi:hypothetical protein